MATTATPLTTTMTMYDNCNKTGARQYTRAVFGMFAEIYSTRPISVYIFLLSPTLGLPPQFIDAQIGVTGISG